MKNETIGVTITFREPITFHLRMVNLDEENHLRQKNLGMPDSEKAKKKYQDNIDLLAELSEELPTARRLITTTEKRAGDDEAREYSEVKEVALVEGETNPAAAVRAYFSEKSVIKERLAEYAVLGYFSKLTPEISFL